MYSRLIDMQTFDVAMEDSAPTLIYAIINKKEKQTIKDFPEIVCTLDHGILIKLILNIDKNGHSNQYPCITKLFRVY